MANSMPLTAAITVREVAQYLRENGVYILHVQDEDDVQDGDITLRNNVHVQVGIGYALVNKIDGPQITMGRERHDALDVLSDVNALVPSLRLAELN